MCNLNVIVVLKFISCSGGFRGGSRGSLEPPLETNYFVFMGFVFMGNLKKF